MFEHLAIVQYYIFKNVFFVQGTRINSRNYKEPRIFNPSNFKQSHAADLYFTNTSNEFECGCDEAWNYYYKKH